MLRLFVKDIVDYLVGGFIVSLLTRCEKVVWRII